VKPCCSDSRECGRECRRECRGEGGRQGGREGLCRTDLIRKLHAVGADLQAQLFREGLGRVFVRESVHLRRRRPWGV
jgi:hypothetical protein